MPSRTVRATAVLATAEAVALGLVAPAAPAGADAFIPLRDSVKSSKIGSGGTITISVKRQSAKLSPGMVALPTTRNAWVSGTVSVKVDGEAEGGAIEAGYAVGCQIDVGSAAVSLGADINSGATLGGSGPTTTPSVSGSTGGSISVAAGSIGTQSLTYDRATWPKPGDEIAPDWYAPATDFSFTGSSRGFS